MTVEIPMSKTSHIAGIFKLFDELAQTTRGTMDLNSVLGKANPIALLLFLIWMAGLSIVSLVRARSSADGDLRAPEAASARS